MADDAAKVIRIELRVRGSSHSNKSTKNKVKKSEINKNIPETGFTHKKQLAAAGAITTVSQLISKGFSIYETLSYNSEEKTDLMMLGIAKTAISSAIVGLGAAYGGVIGAAVGMAINQFVVEPVATGGAINIQRNLDQTRATNRFYQTNFMGKGTLTFDYSSSTYINEDLEKVRKGSFYKKGSAI